MRVANNAATAERGDGAASASVPLIGLASAVGAKRDLRAQGATISLKCIGRSGARGHKGCLGNTLPLHVLCAIDRFSTTTEAAAEALLSRARTSASRARATFVKTEEEGEQRGHCARTRRHNAKRRHHHQEQETFARCSCCVTYFEVFLTFHWKIYCLSLTDAATHFN